MPDGVNIPGGPSFIGTPQPPDVPCDPTGDAWRGEPGPMGPPGPQGIPGPVAGGGPFLPLSGGTVTGPVVVQFDQAVTAAYHGFTICSGAISGTRTGGDWQLSLLQTTSDTLDAGGGGFVGQYIHMHSGGPGTAGNRVGQYIDFHHAGSTLDKARGYPCQYGGFWSYAWAEGNAGGTSTAGDVHGVLWGGIASSRLMSGATYWATAIGLEIDVGVGTGASAAYVQGLKVVIQGHNQAPQVTDFLVGMAKTQLTDSGMRTGISFGSYDGYWPIDTSGTLIGTQGSNLPTPPAMQATNGVDLSAVTFSGAAFRSTGFQITGVGHATSAGIDFGSVFATGSMDLSKHINLYGGQVGICLTSDTNLNYNNTGAHAFYVGATLAGYIVAGGLNGCAIGVSQQAIGNFTTVRTGTGAGPTWTGGGGPPASTQPIGSMYSRTDGGVGTTLYVSRGAGTWAAVAGV